MIVALDPSWYWRSPFSWRVGVGIFAGNALHYQGSKYVEKTVTNVFFRQIITIGMENQWVGADAFFIIWFHKSKKEGIFV